jgi:sec-independent protein translocase protein TatA
VPWTAHEETFAGARSARTGIGLPPRPLRRDRVCAIRVSSKVMPGWIGFPELLILLVVVLLVFGPKRLPEMGRSLGRGMREFKDSVTGRGRDDDRDDLVELPVGTQDTSEPAPPRERNTVL